MTLASRSAALFSLLFTGILAGRGAAQTPCQGTVGPDVIVGDITGPANYTSGSGLEALSLGTTSCNQGTVGVGWHSNTNQHPVIGGELYRFKVVNGAGRFEQVGLSWLKHGFFAESQQLCCTNCQATDGTNLGVGCSDPYTASRNGTQSLLGPRYQVNPNTGLFTYPPPNPSGGNTGRLQVLISDLETSSPSGTRYFGNCQYIAPDDATQRHGNNNCSYKEVTVTGSGSAWNFGLSGSTQREIPAIRAWPTCESGVTVRNIQLASEGLLILDYKTTPLGGGQYHYEYALYNMNSDDSVRSFSIPIASGVTVTNLGFHDVTYRGGDGVGGTNYDGTDWPSAINAGTLAWTTSSFAANPNANAIRWGTTYNFRFDANTAPTAGTATIGLFKSGGSTSAQTDVPSAGSQPDCNQNGIPDSLDIQNGTSQDCDHNGVPDECQTDTDHDGTIDACDGCPSDPNKIAPGVCGCGVADTDSDGDGTPNCNDGCPNDPNKIAPGVCGCGVADTDSDGDGTPNCNDGCPNDPNKIAPGVCGCGVADTDSDGDGTPNCNDGCPNDPNKIAPGVCGCGVADTDSDGDGTPNCHDGCPNDPNKIAPGACGCGVPDTDTDGDGTPNCHDGCPNDPNKIAPGACGCGVPDTDSDGDGTPDCHDGCPNDPNKTAPGVCGCGVADTDSDGDGTPNCHDGCPNDPNKIAPGACGCGVPDTDSDGDGTPDCHDGCPNDPNKTAPGACGCGVADTDRDGDGTPDCHDGCPDDPNKVSPGVCGCGVPDTDSDGDRVPDCIDNCVQVANLDQGDCNHDGVGDACEIAAGAPDCNANGIPDACDIASGTSLDQNGDGIPDSCEQRGTPYCFGDGTGAACPCANSGAPGHGCANSIQQSAQVTAAGTTSPDTIVLSAAGELPTALTVFMQGTTAIQPVIFGDGLRCVGGSLKRLYSGNASAGVVYAPHAGQLSITQRSAVLGDPIPAGGTRYYMTYYRDASPTFCPSPPGGTFNASNALSITW